MVKIEKTRLICGQQLRTQPRGEPKAVCPCWEMCTCLWWGVCTSHHWLAEEKMTFSSLWTLQGSKNFVLMCVWGAWKSQVLISDRDPWAPARRLILKTRLQRSRSNMASCAGWQQESAISVVRGLSNISFAAMHYRKTSTGKVLHICHEKKRNKRRLAYRMNFGILTGQMLYVTEVNTSPMEEECKCLHCFYVIQLSSYIRVVYLMHALQ